MVYHHATLANLDGLFHIQYYAHWNYSFGDKTL